MVHGEPGVGNTALLEYLARAAATDRGNRPGCSRAPWDGPGCDRGCHIDAGLPLGLVAELA